MPRLHFHWLDAKVSDAFRCGVSLHSHTSHSREGMNLIPEYARQSRALSVGIRALCSRYREQTGTELDFSRLFFTPPLSASEAFRIEAAQIEHELNLEALVSLTDHDSIEAPLRLRMFMDERQTPISMEWTVPFLDSLFHVGIHNLQTKGLQPLLRELAGARCQRCQDAGTSCSAGGMLARHHAHINLNAVAELFARLSSDPQTLVVLNHPLWNTAAVHADRHRTVLSAFLTRFGRHIHAIELNGLRPWTENLAAMDLAERWSLPVISGGDRHGSEPNAILNLTRQDTFSAFVDEIRLERLSEIVIMRQYREPLKLRKIRTAVDLLREYPHHPEESRRWPDRVYIPWNDGATIRLSEVWKNTEPPVLQGLVSLIRLLEAKPMRSLLRLALEDEFTVNSWMKA
jgi:hypothetical protein